MKSKRNFWKKHWDSLSQGVSSDHEIDRGVLQDEEIERLSGKRLIDFIGPQRSDFVFDAGCGTGINLRRLSSRVKGMIGMDYSEGMISRAKKRIVKENIPNVRLMVGDILNIGLESDTFDKIICISVFQYLSDEECEEALREFVRIAKDGAILVLHIKNLSSLYLFTLYVAKKLKSLLRKNVKIEYYRSYRWYEERLSKLGGHILDYYSGNIFVLDFLPRSLLFQLQRMEMKYYRGKLLGKYGADVNIRAKIKKANT